MNRWVGGRQDDDATYPRSPTRSDVSIPEPIGAPTAPRKTAYRSQAEALSVADERRDDTGLELNVYRCDFCSAWHMGNAEGRR